MHGQGPRSRHRDHGLSTSWSLEIRALCRMLNRVAAALWACFPDEKKRARLVTLWELRQPDSKGENGATASSDYPEGQPTTAERAKRQPVLSFRRRVP